MESIIKTENPSNAGDYLCWIESDVLAACHWRRKKGWLNISTKERVKPLAWAHCVELPPGNVRPDNYSCEWHFAP